ncbi:MAG: PEP/pyruvate-binding domain-containing protein, partial [Planctomycetota bacterium]
MKEPQRQVGDLLRSLTERAKELNCLYGVEEILNEPDVDPATACRRIIEVIPPGWQHPDSCVARIELKGEAYASPEFLETPWRQSATIRTQTGPAGSISVFYTEQMPDEDEGPFLKEEARLIRTIADRLGHFLQHYEMRSSMQAVEAAREDLAEPGPGDWRVVLDLLSRTDTNLFQKISQKLLYYLCWSGVNEAEKLLQSADVRGIAEVDLVDPNRPRDASPQPIPADLGQETFRIAARHLSNEALLTLLQKWVREDRLSFLVSAVERNLPLPEISDAIRRYHHLEAQEGSISKPASAHIRVALIRRFFSEQLDYIRIAKEHFDIEDFYELIPRVIAAPESHGRLGGKSAGLLLAAKIAQRERENHPALGDIRSPKTWHVTSDMHVRFMHFNNLDEMAEQKYKDISQVRFEYPHIIHTCKNSRFPPELVNGLSVALDDLGDTPLIVRSSSVLEDRVGAAFSGKYKSLFVGNQGTKSERMHSLLDAIAEVYASMFGPDPIQYRSERGLLDFSEEMGIIIQEVVGKRIGRYFFPLFAGVALSRNEFRWSPRIRREDGIIRLVPGLGTRAVDRVGDDYPVMFAPGQPNLRVNVTPDEVLRYSPRWLDVIDVESNTFVTLPVAQILKELGEEVPGLFRLLSVYQDGRLRAPTLMDTDLDPDDVVLTFEGQLADRAFVEQMRAVLEVLEEKTGGPVDIEFAHDGEHLHLLQCRSQGGAEESLPAPIPKDVPRERIIFSANRYVSNGLVPDISHIVYVDPDRYTQLTNRSDLNSVGRAVGELNKLLPKRQFILMGPGRWGSRGDIKLGVSVSYADINNTAAL